MSSSNLNRVDLHIKQALIFKSLIVFFLLKTKTDFVGARRDPGCASSWQSPTAIGASQFMFPLSHPGM